MLKRADVMITVLAMADTIPFFPQAELAKTVIADALLKFIATQEQLDWFGPAACQALSKYEGIPALRALFCTRYTPADGQQATVTAPGYGPDDLETEYQQRVMAENDERFQRYREAYQLLPAEERAPLLLPDPRPMPKPTTEDIRATRLRFQSLPDTGVTPIRSEEERRRLVRELADRIGLKEGGAA